MELPQRFWNKVDKEGPLWQGTPCWQWTASQHGQGYGAFWWQGRQLSAHRVSYLAHVGPIPEDLDLDHLCRNRLCVNPAHLEPVTRQTNLQRGEHVTKLSWPPCSVCGDPDGPVHQNGKTPWRITGARFGVDGVLCYRCYNRLQSREQYRAKKRRQGSRKETTVLRRQVEVDGVQHTVLGHDPAREEYFVSASDNAESGAFYLCSIRAGRRACTCKRGQYGFGHGKASAEGSRRASPSRAHCRHVEAALRASVLEAAARLGALVDGPQGLPNPFADDVKGGRSA